MSIETRVPESSTEAERWAAWQAKGAADHRAVRRKMAMVIPIVAVAAGLVYALMIL